MDCELGVAPAGTIQVAENPGAAGDASLNGVHLKILTGSALLTPTGTGGPGILLPSGLTKVLRLASSSSDTPNTINPNRYVAGTYGYDPLQSDFNVVGGQDFQAYHFDGQDYVYINSVGIYDSQIASIANGNGVDDPATGGWDNNTNLPSADIKIFEWGHDDGYIDGAFPASFYTPTYTGHNAFGCFIGWNRTGFTQFGSPTNPANIRPWNTGGATVLSNSDTNCTNWDQPHFAVQASNRQPWWFVTAGFGDNTTIAGGSGGNTQWVLRPIVKNVKMWFICRWLKYDYSAGTAGAVSVDQHGVQDNIPGVVQIWAISDPERIAFGSLAAAMATPPLVWYIGSTNQWAEPSDGSAWDANNIDARRPSGNPRNAPHYMRKRPTFTIPATSYHTNTAVNMVTYHVPMDRYISTGGDVTNAFRRLIGSTDSVVAPANTVLPSISGTKTQGQTLTGADGTWTGAPSPAVTARQWLRCDATGANPVAINGATATTYVLTANDIGSTIRFSVTEANTGGTVTATSAATTAVAAAGASTTPSVGNATVVHQVGDPFITSTPTITDQDRALLTAIHDAYPTAVTGVTAAGMAMTLYQPDVNNDHSGGTTCYKLVGPIAGMISVTATDSSPRQQLMSCVPLRGCDTMTVVNTAASSSAYGNTVSVTCPSAAGDLVVMFVTAKHTATQGTPTLGASQTLVGQDESGFSGSFVKAFVTSKVAVGASTTLTATLSPTPVDGWSASAVAVKAAVNQAQPVNSVAPAVSGTAMVGATLTMDNGTWSNVDGATVYTRQWYTITPGSPPSTVPIAGATAATYLISNNDIGRYLFGVVTATTTAGAASAASNVTVPVAAAAPTLPPVFSHIPTITGTATVGSTLTTDWGTVDNGPADLTFEWIQQGTLVIPNVTGLTYTLTDGDVGTTIRTRVTATNAFGTAVSTSDPTSAVANLTPVVIVNPILTGLMIVGQTLSVTTGLWLHTVGITYAYQWQRTDANGGNAVDIGGATSSTYVVALLDLRVQCLVTATNSAGSASATSNAGSLVAVAAGRTSPLGRVLVGTRSLTGTKTFGGGGL